MSLFSLQNGQEIVQYDIDDVKVAVNNGDGTFGPLVDVPSCDLFVTGFNSKNQTMKGDGRITVVSAAAESAECQVRFGTFAVAVFEILLGSTPSYSGVTPNRSTKINVGAGQNYPFWAIVGRSPDGLAKGGATLIFLPYVKIMQNVSVRLEYNGFMMPEVTAMAVGDPYLLSSSGDPLLWEMKAYETKPTIAMPLP